jgi:hypothetical protein
MAIDPGGDIVVTGSFRYGADFGGDTFASAGEDDIFLAKFSATGAHIWSRAFGSSGSDIAYSVATDPSGNILFTGSFQNTVDFGGTPLTSMGGNDIFLCKFDPTGTHLWSRRFGGTAGDRGASVAVDSQGRIGLTGLFNGTANFGGATFSSAGFQDIFIAAYEPTGSYRWSHAYGSGSSDWGTAVACDDQGNLFAIGLYHASLSFGGPPLPEIGEGDMFLAKYDSAGAHIWSHGFGASGADYARDLDVDGSGDVVITGQFAGTADFGGAPLVSNGWWDVVLARYDPDGTHLWSRHFGGTGGDKGSAVRVDEAGIALIGTFAGTADLGGGALTALGHEDEFVARYDGDGNHLWSRQLGDSLYDNDNASAVARDRFGNVIAAGTFLGTVDFGGGPLVSNSYDLFLVAYSRSTASSVTVPDPARPFLSSSPNPFNPSTNITFRVSRPGPVSLAIYNTRGALIASLVSNQILDAGDSGSVPWNGTNARGLPVASGIYFARLVTTGGTHTRKLVLLK